MAKIIAFVSRKGGVGKSTLAGTFAYAKATRRKFEKITLVELDPQGTLKDWHQKRLSRETGEYWHESYNVDIVQILNEKIKEIKNRLSELLEKNDLLILDLPGESVSQFATVLAIYLADLCVLPMRSTTKDESSFERQLLPLITDVINEKSGRKNSFYILPTFFNPASKSENIQKYFMELMPAHIQCLPVFLPMRTVFENFDREGQTLMEYKRSIIRNKTKYNQAGKAIMDVEKIAAVLIKTLYEIN